MKKDKKSFIAKAGLCGNSGYRTVSALIALTFVISNAFADLKKWSGIGADGSWANAANWSGGSLPQPTDDIILDNSIVQVNYTVTLPNTAVLVKTLSISPTAGNLIQLLVPAGNLAEPGFSATGPGYGMVIDNGGIFQNASGLSGGESLAIADSIRINNGGKYIHRTRASHANNIVRLLSSAAGTENGIFEFDVPRSSYTVSMSNRKYGNLVLSAVAAGGAISYTCNGSNTLTINGNMQINEGVNFAVDLGGLNGNINISGDLIQNGGIFNLASGAGNTTVVRVEGNCIQSAGGLITETNSGIPCLELNGSSQQIVSLAGGISNNVIFRMNNHEGAVLLSPLKLPYRLELLQGKIISSSTNLLTLADGSEILADSTSANTSFVDGPLRKEGLNNNERFLFPTGKNASLRWLELRNATGNFTVEYFRNDPRNLSTIYGNGIAHISNLEYWTVAADQNSSPGARIELSFAAPGSGGITDLNYLNVTGLSGGSWIDEGHEYVTGTFNSAGSITSGPVTNFENPGFFTLASTVDLGNPLPLNSIDLYGQRIENRIKFHWRIDFPGVADSFQLMKIDGEKPGCIYRAKADDQISEYDYDYQFMPGASSYYQLLVSDVDGNIHTSRIIKVGDGETNEVRGFELSISPSPLTSIARLSISTEQPEMIRWKIIASDGRVCRNGEYQNNAPSFVISLDLSSLAPGIYYLVGINSRNEIRVRRFLKL